MNKASALVVVGLPICSSVVMRNQLSGMAEYALNMMTV
jgi:hypothetical protein